MPEEFTTPGAATPEVNQNAEGPETKTTTVTTTTTVAGEPTGDLDLPEFNPLVKANVAGIKQVIDRVLSKYKKVFALVTLAVILSLGSSGWVFYKQVMHTNANRIQAQADQFRAQVVASCNDSNTSREQVRLTLNNQAEGQANLTKTAMFDLVAALEGSHPGSVVKAQGARFEARVTALASQTVSTFEGETQKIYAKQNCAAKYSPAKAAALPAVSFASVYAAADQFVVTVASNSN